MNKMRYVGWSGGDELSSAEIQRIRRGVHAALLQHGFNVIPSAAVVISVFDQMNDGRRPRKQVLPLVCDKIWREISAEMSIARNNASMTAWDSIRGNYNLRGLGAHDTIKLRAKGLNHEWYETY